MLSSQARFFLCDTWRAADVDEKENNIERNIKIGERSCHTSILFTAVGRQKEERFFRTILRIYFLHRHSTHYGDKSYEDYPTTKE